MGGGREAQAWGADITRSAMIGHPSRTCRLSRSHPTVPLVFLGQGNAHWVRDVCSLCACALVASRHAGYMRDQEAVSETCRRDVRARMRHIRGCIAFELGVC